MRLTKALAVGVAILAVGVAHANPPRLDYIRWTPDSEKWTGLSGRRGPETVLLRPYEYDRYYVALAGLHLGQGKGDRPCRMRSHPGMLDETLATPPMDKGQVSLPDCGTSSSKMARLGNRQLIRAIQVCTTKKNDPEKDRMKGLRIWGYRLHPGGKLTEVEEPVEVKRPNCRKWHAKRTCPGRRVATAVRLYHDGRSLQGAALRCNEIEYRNPNRK